MNLEGGYPTIVNTSFVGNRAGFSGGAIRGWQSDPVVVNGLLVGNTAEAGGAAWFGASAPAFRSCTFADNVAPLGGALAFDSCCPQQPSFAEATDCVLWNGGGEVLIVDGSAVSLSYCIVDGGHPGMGNSAEDPLFIPGPLGAHYLSQAAAGQPQDSPGLNAGSDTASALGLAARTTRSDEVEDGGLADLGYHFAIAGRDLLMGDDDRNGRLDLFDFTSLQRGFSGDLVEQSMTGP
jgi:hypothetical protein